MFLTRHFKEPAIAASSSFTEGASVFGGGSNLKTAVKNIFDMYDPQVIAVHTTCLSETIGDDLNSFIQDIEIPDGKYVLHTNTPSYVGSHVTGFSNMMSGFIKYMAGGNGGNPGKLAIFPGFVNPGDMREIKRMLNLMGVPAIIFPDTSGVMDAPMTGSYDMYPEGGTRIADIKDLGNCQMTIGLGQLASEQPASDLRRKCHVPYQLLPLPIGVSATDQFLMAVSDAQGVEIAKELDIERGQLVDILLDSHPYTHKKRVAIFGDPDTVLGLTAFVLEMGMEPAYLVTGTPGEAFVVKAKDLCARYAVENCVAKSSADLFELHQWIKNDPVDLLMGGTHGKAIARAEDIPFVRAGFPIIDRYVHAYQPLIGYRGGIRLAEMILNTLMDRLDRDAADEDFEMVL